MWALLALGAAALTSFNPILYKRMVKDTPPSVVVWSVTLLSLPMLGMFAIFLTRRLPGLDWLFAVGILGSAILNVGAFVASTQALRLADVSLITPLLIFSPVFTVLLSALLLAETPSSRALLGIGLVLVGAYWLDDAPRKNWLAPFASLALRPGVLLVLFAGLLWSITPIFEKVAIQHTLPESPEFVAFVGTALLTVLLTPVAVKRSAFVSHSLLAHRRDLLLAGIIAGVAPVLSYTAFSLGFVGYVTALFKLSTLMTVLWGWIFLKEQGLTRRLPISILMILGAGLIALG